MVGDESIAEPEQRPVALDDVVVPVAEVADELNLYKDVATILRRQVQGAIEDPNLPPWEASNG